MTDNTELAELIDNYLAGNLNQKEKTAFETRLSNEAGLTEQVVLHQKAVAGIKAASRAKLLAAIQAEDATMDVYQAPTNIVSLNRNTRYRIYWVAAAVVLLLIPLFLFLERDRSSEKLFSQYFAPYDVPATGDSSASSAALQHYEKENYALALPLWEKMLGKNPSDAAAQFYTGNSQLALNHTQDAIASFEAVIEQAPNQYVEEAEWYLALSYLKANRTGKARQSLKKIAASPHPYQQQARQVLGKL